MLKPSEDLQRRRPVWEALSDLFLDTEIQSFLGHIARVLAESGYTDEELHGILFNEVYPACIPNLHHPAGVWSGFHLESLEEQILEEELCPQTNARIFPPDYWMIQEEWRTVQDLLPEARLKVKAVDP